MSDDWLTLLNQTLSHLKQTRTLRVALMGVGHELRSDDGAGVLVARALQSIFDQNEHILIVEGGNTPENHTGKLRRFAPDIVLLIDAADMAEPAGTVRWLTCPEIGGLDAFTHTLPLNMIAQYIRQEMACDIALIGIQPAQLDIGMNLSPQVRVAVETLIRTLSAMLMDL